MIGNLYFEKIPIIDSLFMEQVLFSYDSIPIVFVCVDKKKTRYLCVCDDVIEEESWLIVEVNNKKLLDILMDESTVLSAFANKKVVIASRKSNENINYNIEEYNNISKDDLPINDQYLEMKNSLKTYIAKIQQDISSSSLTLAISSSDILSDNLEDSIMVISMAKTYEPELTRTSIINSDIDSFIDGYLSDSTSIKINYQKDTEETIIFTNEIVSIAYAA